MIDHTRYERGIDTYSTVLYSTSHIFLARGRGERMALAWHGIVRETSVSCHCPADSACSTKIFHQILDHTAERKEAWRCGLSDGVLLVGRHQSVLLDPCSVQAFPRAPLPSLLTFQRFGRFRVRFGRLGKRKSKLSKIIGAGHFTTGYSCRWQLAQWPLRNLSQGQQSGWRLVAF